MKIQSVTVVSLKNLGEYAHEKLEVTALVEDGDKLADVTAKLQDAVLLLHRPTLYERSESRRMRAILENPEKWAEERIIEAKEWQRKEEERLKNIEDLPF